MGLKASFIKIRPRVGARWSAEEMDDLRDMLDAKLSLEDLSCLLGRTPKSVIRRIAQNRLNRQGEYLPELRRYHELAQKFARFGGR